MIGLDTNVLVRLITRDDEQQAALARSTLGTNAKEVAFVNRATVLELVWVLESAYSYEATIIADAIDVLLDLETITVEDASVVRRATRLYRAGADFADALVTESNLAQTCRSTLTFDRRAAKTAPGMQLLR